MDIDFSAKIEQLQAANAKLHKELEEWKEKASAESERVKFAEEQLRRLYERTEEQLREMCDSNQQLQEQVNSYATTTEYLKSMLSKCFQDLGTALPVLEELKKGVSLILSWILLTNLFPGLTETC